MVCAGKKESGPPGLGECGGLLQPRHGHRGTRALGVDREVRKHAGGVVEGLGEGSHAWSLGKPGAVLKHWPLGERAQRHCHLSAQQLSRFEKMCRSPLRSPDRSTAPASAVSRNPHPCGCSEARNLFSSTSQPWVLPRRWGQCCGKPCAHRARSLPGVACNAVPTKVAVHEIFICGRARWHALAPVKSRMHAGRVKRRMASRDGGRVRAWPDPASP